MKKYLTKQENKGDASTFLKNIILKNRSVPAILLILFVFIGSSQAALTSLEISQQEKEKAEASSEKLWFKNLNAYRQRIAEEYGANLAFLVNYAQQAIVDSKRDAGKSRSAWYWNFEISQKAWPQGVLFAELEMDRGKGADKFLPTFSSFNENSGDDAWLYIPALYLEQSFFADRVFLSAGKLDLSYWFDCNEAANSADTQFLSSSLVNSPVIPFPAKGFGAMLNFKPYKWLYFQSGASSAKASSTKIGLSGAFNSAFFISELGLSPEFASLKGNYRFILRANHQKLEYINLDETKKNDSGWALSFDQAITKRVTLFLRYGFADPQVRDIEYFWSGGAQVVELIPGRKRDILGVGVARSIISDDYRQANGYDETSRSEIMYELYYSYNLNSFSILTPNIQIVSNPNADKAEATEIVCGLRLLLSF